jgi:signal transduction histidine kinase/ActR/RegA family two-component response regulator
MVVGIGLAAFAVAFFNKRVHGIIPGTRATLYESLRDGILVVDANNCVIEVWPAAERFLQTDRSLLLGRPVDEVLKASFESVADGGAGGGSLMRSRAEERYVELERCPLRTKGADSEGELFLLHDVTKRRRSEEESRRLEAQIQRAQKLESLGRLSGGVAHDFNNILTIVLLNAELARDAEERDVLEEHLDNIKHASSRAVELVRQLLAFSRTPQVEMKPLRIGKVIADTVRMISETFDRRIEIRAHVEDKLPPVLGNMAQLQQVLLNLCINARDAIEQSQRMHTLETPRITLLAEAVAVTPEYCQTQGRAVPGPYVCLSVSDTGTGMDEETQRQIFEPFFTTKEVGKGTGLGLAIVYGIIRQHKGWIEVKSEPDAGSTFQIFLPAVTSSDPEREALDAETLAPRGTGTVLLVDDEELILKAGRTMLNDLGYTPLTAASGPEAVRVFEAQHEDIAAVILDLSMPGMSGYEVLQEIRRIQPEARVLIASGYSTAGIMAPLEDMVAAFVPKPYQVVDIARALRKVLDRTERD